MEKVAKLPLNKLIEHFQLEVLYGPQNIESVDIKNTDINRPGLQMVGFSKFFENVFVNDIRDNIRVNLTFFAIRSCDFCRR